MRIVPFAIALLWLAAFLLAAAAAPYRSNDLEVIRTLRISRAQHVVIWAPIVTLTGFLGSIFVKRITSNASTAGALCFGICLLIGFLTYHLI